MTGRRALRYALPVSILAAIVGAVIWAFTAPLYREYTLGECLEAYGKARSMSDTQRVDAHPYRNERDNRRMRHRCAEIRAQSDSVLLRQTIR